MIYKKDSKILSYNINGSESNDKILLQLFAMLKLIRVDAVKKGIFVNPVTGDIGNIPMSVLMKKADEIKALGGKVDVVTLANADISSTGPLDIRIILKPI